MWGLLRHETDPRAKKREKKSRANSSESKDLKLHSTHFLADMDGPRIYLCDYEPRDCGRQEIASLKHICLLERTLGHWKLGDP